MNIRFVMTLLAVIQPSCMTGSDQYYSEKSIISYFFSPYSVHLNDKGEQLLKFMAPRLVHQKLELDRQLEITRYNASSNNGVRIFVLANRLRDGPGKRCSLSKSANLHEVSRLMSKVEKEVLKTESLEAELATYRSRLNLGSQKAFAAAHAYFVAYNQCINIYVSKTMNSKNDKSLVKSIVHSIKFNQP